MRREVKREKAELEQPVIIPLPSPELKPQEIVEEETPESVVKPDFSADAFLQQQEKMKGEEQQESGSEFIVYPQPEQTWAWQKPAQIATFTAATLFCA